MAVTIYTRRHNLILSRPIIADRYRIADPKGQPLLDDATQVTPLGKGGFGVVFRGVDQIGMHRALKLVPQPQMAPECEPILSDQAKLEITLSNAQPFKHVIPVIDYGASKDIQGNHFEFFASAFVEGTTLEMFVRRLLTKASFITRNSRYSVLIHDAVLTIIADILGALVELDQAEVAHLDIKPQNILVNGDISFLDGEYFSSQALVSLRQLKAFIIDLGSARPMNSQLTGRTRLTITDYWFPTSLIETLSVPPTGLMPDPTPTSHLQSDYMYVYYASLRNCWRSIDAIACGRVLEWMLLDRSKHGTLVDDGAPLGIPEVTKESFWRMIFADDFDVLKGYVNRLLNAQDNSHHSIAAQRAFDAIPFKHARAIFASDSLTDRYPTKQFRTSGDLVRVGFPFDEIVNHRHFQRLRLIQQLAFVSDICPDGTHTRFSHSLRTFHLAKRFIAALHRKSIFRLTFERHDVDRLLASALLHDIGQYPFAHSIEDLRKMGDLSSNPQLQMIKHDQELAVDILQRGPDRTIWQLLQDSGINGDDIGYIIGKSRRDVNRGPALNISRDLISGVIDVDRISYLIHDSQHTGAHFGEAVDVSSLGDALTVQIDANNDMDGHLAIEEHGVSAAEAVLMGVCWMYRNVYWMQRNRAFMAALKFVFRELLLSKQLTFESYFEDTLFMSDWETLRLLRDKYNVLANGDVKRSFNPIADFVDMRQLGYERIYTLRCASDQQTTLYQQLIDIISLENERILVERIGDALPRSASPIAGEILLDIPLKRRLSSKDQLAQLRQTAAEEATRDDLRVCIREAYTRRVRSYVGLREYSPVAKELGNIEDISARKIRVFVANRLLARLREYEIQSLPRKIEDILVRAVDGSERLIR